MLSSCGVCDARDFACGVAQQAEGTRNQNAIMRKFFAAALSKHESLAKSIDKSGSPTFALCNYKLEDGRPVNN
jgi:hypothetical protein